MNHSPLTTTKQMWIAIILIEVCYIITARVINYTIQDMSFVEETLFTLNRIVISLIVLYLFGKFLKQKKPNYSTLKSPWLAIAMLFFLAIPLLQSYLDDVSSQFKLFYAFTSIFVAIHEEIVYRGVIQELFLKYLSPIKAILVTSVIFTIYHIGMIELNINLYIQIFLASIILGIIYYKTQSLILVIAMHTIYDALIPMTPIGDTTHSIITYSEGTLVMIVALLSVWIWYKSNTNQRE